MSSGSGFEAEPFLEIIPDNVRTIETQTRWWWRVLDWEETKRQVLFSLPMILTNLFYLLITLVSVMFAGHLGEVELAGATLANSWATVTGFAFMTGLSGALETLCGQSFGAKLYKMLGIHLQASCIISLLFCVVISVIWLYTEPILILLHQDSEIASAAAVYMKYLIPGLFAYGWIQSIVRFLQAQSVVSLLVLFSMVPLGVHVGICYVLVNLTPLGFKGPPLAASITLWISAVVLVVYVLSSSKFEHTWDGFSLESFRFVFANLKLALPSAAMICVNTENLAYMLTYGLSAAASTRASNELGADNPDRAKHAMTVTIKLSVFLALVVVLALGLGCRIWAGLFSSIWDLVASMAPFLGISITLDSVQGVLSGIARGCGWQHTQTLERSMALTCL